MPDTFSRIFLLSHMRACTSLAGHILGSHPWINGYYELHLGYADAAALDRQLRELSDSETIKPHSRYLFDKLLHNEYPLALDRLGAVECHLLLALQEPQRTICSIVALFAANEPGARYASPAGAAAYYIERLHWLAGYCQVVARPYLYYDAEVLRSDSGRWLAGVTCWLQLEPALSPQYQLFSQTGKPRKGDSSVLIHSGRIVAQRTDYSQVQIPGEWLARAQQAYRECRAVLVKHAARVIEAGD